jgi:hypothetical protein
LPGRSALAANGAETNSKPESNSRVLNFMDTLPVFSDLTRKVVERLSATSIVLLA